MSQGEVKGESLLGGMEMEDVAEYLQTRLMAELMGRAEEVLNEYWMAQHARKHGEGVEQGYGKVGCRIVEGKRTFRLEWFRRDMLYVRGEESGVKTRFTRYPIKNNKLNMRSVGDSPEWEKELISKADKQFEKIRNAMEHMKRIHYSIRGVKEQMAELDKVMGKASDESESSEE